MTKYLLNKVIVFFNAFSLWVVLGAFCCFLFTQHFVNISLDFYAATVLALSVWLIYTTDHYLDGMRLPKNKAMPRHFLHRKYAKVILVVAGLMLLVDVYLAYQFLNINYLFFGVVLFGATGIHFIINFLVPIKLVKMLYLKEFFIAIVVAFAYTILPLQRLPNAMEEILLFGFFVFLNSTNLLLFSWYDAEEEPTVLSLPNVYGKSITVRLAGICLVIALCILLLVYLYTPFDNNVSTTVILGSMLIGTGALLVAPSRLKKNGFYRLLGDAIYVLPVLAFL